MLKRLLQVTTLSALVLLQAILMVSCQESALGLEHAAGQHMENSPGVKRHYKLYSQCSGRHVQMLGQNITALGPSDSQYTNLTFETVQIHHITALHVLGERTGRYLCFNRKGKLISRFNGRSRRCALQEVMSRFKRYVMLRSVYNENWMVGFSRKGKPLNGEDHKKRGEHCFHFTKRSQSQDEFPKKQGPHIPEKLFEYLLPHQRLK